ncbi:Membrane protein involved in the export of O-antigen and teichoic acid [Cyclonatronum proteinivorum]|uniref:Membrane protein involved in the export of O-antigen and teichoic acid n=1 Tax=Cyclonatronum proteinivorum TaxID=1457365 RepID=A0A345UG91_9BACT|nr:polysaccharide biosynthesis C-terminal domain-containing protein [Cyclonatronum proteinivorum]AXI99492.1 Membrane protein involved in the export of O-antigen and teichoic acid [Cyclonatronum proteinivorum]
MAVSRIKELFSDSVVYGLSSVVARFINYLLVPFYTMYFNPAEYGIVGLVYAAIMFLGVLYTFGMESAYIRYAKGSDTDDKKVFVTLQLSLLAVASVLGALLYFAGKPLLLPLMSLDFDGGARLFVLMLSILWLDSLTIVPYAHLRIVRQSWVYAVIKLLNVLINVSLNLYLVIVQGWGIEAIFISNIIASGSAVLLLIIACRHMYAGKPELAVLKTALIFGLPYVPNGIGFAINEVIDRFFLVRMDEAAIEAIYGHPYTADEITGIYNACYKIAVFMLLGVQMFRLAWQPFFMRYAEAKDSSDLFGAVFFYFNLACGAIFLTVGIFAKQIVALQVPVLGGTLIDSRYWSGLEIVPYLLLAYWFQGWFINFSAGIFIKDQTLKFPRITLYGAVITLGGNIILVPYFGMVGSAVATLLCYGFMSMLAYGYAQKYYPVNYPLKSVIFIMLSMVGLVFLSAIHVILPVQELFWKIILFGTGTLLLLAVLLRFRSNAL